MIRSTFGGSTASTTRLGLDDHRVASGQLIEVFDRPARERADVGGAVLRFHDPRLRPVDVEQILEQPVELARVGGEPDEEVVAVLLPMSGRAPA